ncbi:hypothetical protein HDF11_002043 [Tunturiibacter psychrotolerans]
MHAAVATAILAHGSPSRFAARFAGSLPGLLGLSVIIMLFYFSAHTQASNSAYVIGLPVRAFQNFVNVSTPSAFTATRSQWRMPP